MNKFFLLLGAAVAFLLFRRPSTPASPNSINQTPVANNTTETPAASPITENSTAGIIPVAGTLSPGQTAPLPVTAYLPEALVNVSIVPTWGDAGAIKPRSGGYHWDRISTPAFQANEAWHTALDKVAPNLYEYWQAGGKFSNDMSVVYHRAHPLMYGAPDIVNWRLL